jgi:hypothetical protein
MLTPATGIVDRSLNNLVSLHILLKMLPFATFVRDDWNLANGSICVLKGS